MKQHERRWWALWPDQRPGWGSGPWDAEDDRVQWFENDVWCLALRQDIGAWNGYIVVPASHPWHGMGHDSVPYEDHPHGGLTFSGQVGWNVRPDLTRINLVGPGADGWWGLGFDCNHAGDDAPGMRRFRSHDTGSANYKTQNFVTGEIKKLALAASNANRMPMTLGMAMTEARRALEATMPDRAGAILRLLEKGPALRKWACSKCGFYFLSDRSDLDSNWQPGCPYCAAKHPMKEALNGR